MLCQPDGSLIPSIKVWLLAEALWDTVASVRTCPPHQLLFKVTENWVWVPAAVGVHSCYKSQNDRKEFWKGEFRPRESQGCQLWLAHFFSWREGYNDGKLHDYPRLVVAAVVVVVVVEERWKGASIGGGSRGWKEAWCLSQGIAAGCLEARGKHL